MVAVLTRALGVRYGACTAVEDVFLAASPGSVTGVVGPNGSGKSSLVKAIAGLVPHAGDVFFDGARLRPARVGYMPQDTGTRAALTVLETVLLGRHRSLGLSVDRRDIERAGETLDEIGIAALAGRHLDELSGGQRQLVFLAQALAGEPSLLLLDEPTSALDIRNQLEVLGLVRKMTRARAVTTLCVLHDLNAAARHADRVALMSAGRLAAQGTPAEVLTAARIADAFGVDAEVTTGADGAVSIVPVRAIPIPHHQTEEKHMTSSSIGRRHALALIAGAALAPVSARAHDSAPRVEAPWARASLGGAKTGAGYMRIVNPANAPDRLIAAESPAAGHMELHEMATVNNVMQMRPIAGGIPVPSSGAVELRPGGLHLMFIDLKAPLAAGRKVPVTLTFEKGGKVTVDLEVRDARDGAPARGHMH